MAICILCENEAAEGVERCPHHDRIYRRGRRAEEDRKTKGLFGTGFEFGAGFALGSTLLLIPLLIIVGIAAAICGLA